MNKVTFLIFFLVFISCTDEENEIELLDPETEKFKNFLATGYWTSTKTVIDDVYFDVNDEIYFDTQFVDCGYEQQFDIVTQMVISRQKDSNDLKVINVYKCSENKITYFRIEKKLIMVLKIIEKDDKGKMIKIYDFLTNSNQSSWLSDFLTQNPHDSAYMTLFSRTFDQSYFDISKMDH